MSNIKSKSFVGGHGQWKLSNLKPISPTVSNVQFSPVDNHEHQNSNYYGITAHELGRHYRVSQDCDKSMSRIYTTCLSLTDVHAEMRRKAYENFEAIMSSETNEIYLHERQHYEDVNTLNFFMKNYNQSKKGISKLLHTINKESSENVFRIEGPIGRGLELSNQTKGSHVIICAGTGVLPFMDWLNLMLWRNMYEVVKSKAGSEMAERFNILGSPLDDCFNGMKITLLASFANPNEFLGMEIVETLAEMSFKFGLNNFTGAVKGVETRYLQKITTRLDRAAVESLAGNTHDKYYIVGPAEFNASIQEGLMKMGVNKYKIMLV